MPKKKKEETTTASTPRTKPMKKQHGLYGTKKRNIQDSGNAGHHFPVKKHPA